MNPIEEYRQCWVESNQASDQHKSPMGHREAKKFISSRFNRMAQLESERPDLEEEFRRVSLECQMRGSW